MLVDFDSLPQTARIWIYQANRSFSDTESQEIAAKLETFIGAWTAHGSNLQASYCIKYRRFIILGLDQAIHQATGCSIDASVRFIQELEQAYQVNLLDKMNVSYKQGAYIAYKSLTDFKQMAKDKAISKNTIVFNNLVTTMAELNTNWEVPAHDSWHSRFF